MADYQTRWSDHGRTQICPSCGARFNPRVGAWPMVPGTYTPICKDCETGADLTFVADRAEIERNSARVKVALAEISAGRVGDVRR